MRLILAIDQSTSATKAVLFDASGNVLDKASRSHRQIYPQPGWVEHDVEEIWRNVLAVIREIADRDRSKLSKLAGLSITNQRETVLVFNRKTGKPLHHDRSKSTDHADCIIRHLVDAGTLDTDGVRHSAKVAWRSLALLQEEIERDEGAPLPRNARMVSKAKELFLVAESAYLAERVRFAQHVDDVVEARLYRPLVAAADALADRARRVQNGSINRYLAFSFTALVAVLLVVAA